MSISPRTPPKGFGRVLSSARRAAGSQPPSQRSDLTMVLSSALAATFIAASLLLLVGVRVAQVQTGYRVHDLRSELMKLRQERAALDVEKASLLRPARLAQLARGSLDLVPVDGARALSVDDAPRPAPTPASADARSGAHP